MSTKSKYPDWFDYQRSPNLFYKPKPTPVITTLKRISTDTLDGKYDHVVYENDEIKVEVDITGGDYDLQLEVRTYKKTSTPNEKYETELKSWEEEKSKNDARQYEWKSLREMKILELNTDRERREYLRLKKIFEPAQK